MGVPYLDEKVLLGPIGTGALEGPPAGLPPGPPVAADVDGDKAGTNGMLAMAAGKRGGVASNDTAAVRGVFLLLLSAAATGPYEEDAQRGVLPASELLMEPTLLMDATRGVLTGVMKGEKPPPAQGNTPSERGKRK